MFTGIVEEVGTVQSIASGKLTVAASIVIQDTRVGDSIAVNGACLTVRSMGTSSFSVDLMPETVKRTTIGQLRPRSVVNLERALIAGGRIGGHLVQGHVDATGRVVSLISEAGSVIARIAAPSEVMRYVVEKGFIAVDGVSLTVVDYNTSSFSVSLVDYTLRNTVLGSKKVGDHVNLEVDIIAKYVEKFRGSRGVTLDFLAEHGFAGSKSHT